MTYRELLKLYKNGDLDSVQSAKIASDIERQEAISEYLFEADTIPELEDLSADCIEEKNSENDSENTFINMINKSIRRAFIKMGIAVGSILLTIVMLVVFVLPNFVNVFYYNPSTIVGVDDGIETNQMSLDMAVYTELFLPQSYRDDVIVEENGYGSYDINVMQTSSIDGNFKNVSGKIERGKLELYDTNLLTKPTSNAFVPSEIGVNCGFGGVGAAGEKEYAMEQLHNLDDGDYYTAYVTLSEVKSYSEFAQWCEEVDMFPDWCAICLKNEDNYYSDTTIGFIYSSSCREILYDSEKYPYLTQFDLSLSSDDFDKPYSEEVMTTHFTSMLRYMNDHEKFCEIMGLEYESYEELIENVENHGLNIYGFTVTAQKDEILKLSETEGVHYIYTKPVY